MSKPPKLHKRTHLHKHFIYFNLHKRCWSLKAEESGEAVQPEYPEGRRPAVTMVKGRVTGHADTLLACNTTTKISESGRQRVIREKRKNVHAGIVATRVVIEPPIPFATTELTDTLSYNPYKGPTFTDRKTGATVTTAPYVLMRSGCNVGPPRVYYGNQLYYAHWEDDDCRKHSRGFISSVELLNYIGLTEFTGKVYASGLLKYECREGHLFYADNDERADYPEYERLKGVMAWDGCSVAREVLSQLK